jgi:hypothetical protein
MITQKEVLLLLLTINHPFLHKSVKVIAKPGACGILWILLVRAFPVNQNASKGSY